MERAQGTGFSESDQRSEKQGTGYRAQGSGFMGWTWGGGFLRIGLVVLSGAEGVDEEEDSSDDDGGVGDVEVGPVVVDDVDLEEIDDRSVGDAVPGIADG